MDIVEFGLYTIKDDYFSNFKSQFWTDNKCENRPNYCTFKDPQNIIWFIPLSSQVEAYQKKIEKDEKTHGSCLFYHIGKINGVNRVFLIGNMFPVSEKYIKKPYTINGIHYVVGNKELIKQVHKKATKYLALITQRKLKSNTDILEIKNILSKQS